LAELDDYRWLIAEGAPWLVEVAQSDQPLTALATRLRRSLSVSRVHLLLEQVELRRRARAKFHLADRMFFAAKGLEQATDELIATYKASRFPAGCPIADVCCGIGGDLLGLAQRGAVCGIERDPVTALLAQANLGAIAKEAGQKGWLVLGDALHWPICHSIAWHIDPDRRPEGRRTTSVDLHDPPVEDLRRLLKSGPHGAVKLAPGSQPPWDWPEQAELEWISRDRQCRQLVAWFGSLAAHPGSSRATRVRSGPVGSACPPVATLVAQQVLRPSIAVRLGQYVYDPDPAVLAADLLGSLADRCGLEATGRRGGYLTGDRAVDDPLADGFEVLEVMPFDVKRLRRHLVERNIGRLEIKKRNVDCDVERLRHRLSLRGDEGGVLIVAPLATGITAIIARRMKQT